MDNPYLIDALTCPAGCAYGIEQALKDQGWRYLQDGRYGVWMHDDLPEEGFGFWDAIRRQILGTKVKA